MTVEVAPPGDGRSPTPGTGSLQGARVLVPRAVGQAATLAARIRALGGVPVEAPVLRIEPGDAPAVRTAVRSLVAGRFVAVCLTSVNGVAALVAGCDAEGIDPRSLATHLGQGAPTHGPVAVGADRGGVLVGVVGPGTAGALREHLGVDPDVVAARSTGRALGAAMPAGTGAVLLPRGDLASDALPAALRTRGYSPVEVVAYRTVAEAALPSDVLAAFARGRVDLVAVTSPSVVRGLASLVGPPPWPAAVVSIGPVTTAACDRIGLPVAAQATSHDLDGLLAALLAVVDHGPLPSVDVEEDV